MIAPIRGLRNLWRRSFAWKVVIVAVAIYIPVWLLWEVASYVMAHRVTVAWEFTNQYGLPDETEKLVGPEIAPEVNTAVPLRKAVLLACEALAQSPDFRSNSYGVGPEMLLDPSGLAANAHYDAALTEADRLASYRTLASIEEPYVLTGYTIVMDSLRLASTEIAIARWMDEQGRHEQAIERLLRLARLTRKWRGKEPTHYAPDVNTNIDESVCFYLNPLLRNRKALNSRCYDAIELEFAQTRDDLADSLAAMQYERINAVNTVNYYTPTGGGVVAFPYDALDLLHVIRYFNRSMEHLSLPPAEATAAQTRMEEEYAALSKDPFHRFFHPISSEGLQTFRDRPNWMAHSKAIVRCLRIVNAMARKNAFDKDLDELGLPADCLIDPFDGKRLRMKKTPDGPIVYTVGTNILDDGGVIDKLKDSGLGPPPPKAKK